MATETDTAHSEACLETVWRAGLLAGDLDERAEELCARALLRVLSATGSSAAVMRVALRVLWYFNQHSDLL